MKKIIPLVVALFLAGSATSQSSSNCISKGKNIVNLYYGVNVWAGVYKAAAATDAIDLKVKSLGPVGLVYEHLVTDKIGIGAEFGYSSILMTYRDPGINLTTGLAEDFEAEWKFTTIRAMFRANFHFAESENFDAYGLVSAGYRGTTFSFKTNDPSYDEANVTFRGFIPFGIKPGLGFRYFFTGNIGINCELAAGTPLIAGGLSLKF